MKKIMISIIMMAGLLLLASCKPAETVGPAKIPESATTPTPIVVPTCTPTATPSPDPAMVPTEIPVPTEVVTEAPKPTKEPTEAPTEAPEPTATAAPTEEPTPEPTLAPTEAPEPTKAPEPTVAPSPVPTGEPGPEPTVEPTESPTESPTETPTEEPTPGLEPTVEPTPTASPTPTPILEDMVYYGWQGEISIDEEYLIVFPDLFNDCALEKTADELSLLFTSTADSEISFRITYAMQTTLEEKLNGFLNENVTVLENSQEEKRVVCTWEENGMIYHGTFAESQYSKILIGDAFGDVDYVTGVMQVIFSYPAERKTEYETAEFTYLVVGDGED